ncbi:MAG: RidA family protein [Thermoplasmata archaeon]|nr:RidA family protein [Thermoplasmata archaeon]
MPGVEGRPSERIRERAILLPPPPQPVGSYAPVRIEGNLAWVSGQIATDKGAVLDAGFVDAQVPIGRARDLARAATLQGLSALHAALGSLDRVRGIVRLSVFVASSPGFARQHEVANGASELLIEVFGEAGRPARSAIGVAALPLNAPVEVELTASIA